MDTATIYIKTVLILLSNAEKYLDQFIIETKPVQRSKHFLNFELNKLKSIIDDFYVMVGPEYSRQIHEEIRSNWDTISVQNVLGMMTQLSDEDRIKIENYAEELLNESLKK